MRQEASLETKTKTLGHQPETKKDKALDRIAQTLTIVDHPLRKQASEFFRQTTHRTQAPLSSREY
jgi:hypothetical protein